MINEEHTLKDFDYTSDTLTYGSHKRVWRICRVCGKETKIIYSNYVNGNTKCGSCASTGRTHSDETKRKLSNLNKGKIASDETKKNMSDSQKGRTHSDETKKKISYGNKGKVRSDETKQRISDNHADVSGKNSHMYGKTHSDKTKQRISATKQNIPYEMWEMYTANSPYCIEFDEAVKEANREKYGRRCFLCNKPESENITSTGKQWKLSVHHVDMNKNQGCDGHKWKLVPTCMKCHNPGHTKRMISCITYILHLENIKFSIHSTKRERTRKIYRY